MLALRRLNLRIRGASSISVTWEANDDDEAEGSKSDIEARCPVRLSVELEDEMAIEPAEGREPEDVGREMVRRGEYASDPSGFGPLPSLRTCRNDVVGSG